MEVGLTYMANDSAAGGDLLVDGTNLTLLILPLKKSTLEENVWLQPAFWPRFEEDDSGIALSVDRIRPLTVRKAQLKLRY